MKLGSIVFELRVFRYNNIPFYYWFEMVYINQIITKTIFEKTLDFFKWSWDYSNVFSLVLLLTISYDFLSLNYILFIEMITKFTDNDLIFNKNLQKILCSMIDPEIPVFSNNILKQQLGVFDLIFQIQDLVTINLKSIFSF